MNEYFIIGNTFAAPFFSNLLEEFVISENPEGAMQKFFIKHHGNVYAANVYANSDAYHKKEDPLYSYRSPKAKKDYGIS